MKFKKLVSALCASAMCALPVGGITVSAVSGGAGTASEPYIISGAWDFYDIEKAPDASYILERSITVSSKLMPEGVDFKGTLDGGGNAITIDFQKTPDGVNGLFDKVSGTVKNLSVSGSVNTTSSRSGMIAGELSGRIESCGVSGAVSGAGESCGGIVGKISGGSLTDCIAEASVSGTASANGAVAGTAENAALNNVHASAKVSASGSDTGAFIGRTDNTSLTNCFYNKSKTNQSFGICIGSDSVTALEDADCGAGESFSGFDFANTWTMAGGRLRLKAYIGSGTESDP